ncbi:esterase-like activity of phytase family protein [Aurantiacibacter odishensis]|uniref:esterase-like activity of phytase family protein n=1 Tax=Aurantiacibacter odishensis TaxID=1155476 RepID=UPI000E711249|nr:esterase-like activity of phytase family protein [Aurantiacibacter odishensis]
MKRRKLAAALLVTLALAPGTLVRTQIPTGSEVDLSVSAVEDLPALASIGGFTRKGVWELSNSRIDFGGYSAMLVLGEDTLRLFSDRGKMLTLASPDGPRTREPRVATVWDRGPLSATLPDIEAAARDPATGDYWLAFENTNAVVRFSVASGYLASRQPPEWQHWPDNSGAEAMARLPDGRFLVLPESDSVGLLHPSDPTDDLKPLAFRFAVPEGYSPTDMAALPDGRVLVLLRQVAWAVPPFATAIAIADPTGLEEGETLDLELLIRLEDILPRENYEALAVDGVDADGTVRLWLASDDNIASFQRTLLARLDWDPDFAHEKAREEP